ncbi:unnamed protein product [Porites evermanni]|uniref:MACPF domain-containing protein n=1 Tax=Porites evermanni TaxID=104178 RepID=A0ABN8R1I7_9CNID|nr:unnamed protein product [Porites evermanni]
MDPEEIKKMITELPQNEPNKSEGLIRKLHGQISKMQDDRVKDQLLNKLESVAYLGLHEDLKEMMEHKGLHLEAIYLVLNYLTSVLELAKYLQDENSSKPDAGLKMISRRLGPDLEVLGRLSAIGIDVTKRWVKNLCKKAPSFKALRRLTFQELEKCCQGADKGEMDEVHRLVENVQSQERQSAALAPNQDIIVKDKESRTADEKKLKKAKELMNEAKVMAKSRSESSKQAVSEKLSEIINNLELPSDWLKRDEVKPEQLFEQLDKIIEHYSNVVESAESYKSELEIVTRASCGRALCGIYYSKYEPPKVTGRPLLLEPTKVILTNPNTAQEINYMKFSAKGAAAEYVRTVGVLGFQGLAVGEVQGGYGHEKSSQEDQSVKSSATSASVLQYIRIAKKTFQLEWDQLKISLAARNMAKRTVRDEESARSFMERFGSHFPAGVQTLGGVFFCIVDAESKSATNIVKLTEAAVNHLDAQISVGFLSGLSVTGASATGKKDTSTGESNRKYKDSSNESFTFSVKSIGPQAANPSTFPKLLSYNSTWALIDRGNIEGYIPVWELIRELGSEFEEAATVLEKTWRKDEEDRKKKLEEKREKNIMAGGKQDLLLMKEEHLGGNGRLSGSFWPTNGNVIFEEDGMQREDAYDKAIELIMQDPYYNICEITYTGNELDEEDRKRLTPAAVLRVALLPFSPRALLVASGAVPAYAVGSAVLGRYRFVATSKYKLKCWEASDDTPTTFCKGPGQLFFSKVLFKWKDRVPGQK